MLKLSENNLFVCMNGEKNAKNLKETYVAPTVLSLRNCGVNW